MVGGYYSKPEPPKKKSRWRRFWDWWWDHEVWQKIGATFIALLFAGMFGFLGWVLFKPEPGASVTEGVVIDMGHYVGGRNPKQYSCWVKVRDEDGTEATWSISDTTYETVSLGDQVQKNRLLKREGSTE